MVKRSTKDTWSKECLVVVETTTRLSFSIGVHVPPDEDDEDGYDMPSVSVARFTEEEPNLIIPDDVIIPDEQVSFEYDYPLRAEVRVEHKSVGGFPRRLIYRLVYEDYMRIYAEEDAAVGDPGTVRQATGGKCGLVNRMRSDGPHGIWGHYMGDLYIEGCIYDKEHKVLRFSIGS
jgi:hypothetical protein